SPNVSTLPAQHPDNPVLQELSDESRLVVSEPLGDLAGAWDAVPESSYGVIQEGQDELHEFVARLPGSWAAAHAICTRVPARSRAMGPRAAHGRRIAYVWAVLLVVHSVL